MQLPDVIINEFNAMHMHACVLKESQNYGESKISLECIKVACAATVTCATNLHYHNNPTHAIRYVMCIAISM